MMLGILLMAGLVTSGNVVQASHSFAHQRAPEGQGAGAAIIDLRTGTSNPPETLIVRSDVLGEKRQVYVQLPVAYEHSEASYPLLFVMDAEWLFDLAAAHVRYYSLDAVTDVKMPRMIVVGIPNTDRDRDYTPTAESGNELSFPTAGEAEEFLRFLEEELIPLLDDRYRTTPGRAIVGWSFSGLFSAFAAIERPHLFGGHLCISPAIWWDQDLIFERMQFARFEHPKRMVFTLGSREAGGRVYESTKRLLRWLEADPIPRLAVTNFEFEDVGHSWGVASALDKGLQALFAGYIAPEDVIDGGMKAIESYYEDLSGHWGYHVIPPGKVLQRAAAQARADGEHRAAIDILNTALSHDPTSSPTHHALGSIYREQGETEEALEHFRRAIQAELLKPVPNEVSLRGYRAAIAELTETTGSHLSDPTN